MYVMIFISLDYFFTNTAYAGSDEPEVVAWYFDTEGDTTYVVAQLESNELRIFDMSGNVIEWCWDWYSREYPISSIDPAGPPARMGAAGKVIRGGSFYDDAERCTVYYRDHFQPGSGEGTHGFRFVRNEWGESQEFYDFFLDSFRFVL